MKKKTWKVKTYFLLKQLNQIWTENYTIYFASQVLSTTNSGESNRRLSGGVLNEKKCWLVIKPSGLLTI